MNHNLDPLGYFIAKAAENPGFNLTISKEAQRKFDELKRTKALDKAPSRTPKLETSATTFAPSIPRGAFAVREVRSTLRQVHHQEQGEARVESKAQKTLNWIISPA